MEYIRYGCVVGHLACTRRGLCWTSSKFEDYVGESDGLLGADELD